MFYFTFLFPQEVLFSSHSSQNVDPQALPAVLISLPTKSAGDS